MADKKHWDQYNDISPAAAGHVGLVIDFYELNPDD